ncbi:MAG: acyltransferase [Legionellales bacterium]|nr:acyltransferase [Legionellales bacterium]
MNKEIIPLTSFRFIAAFIVFIFHIKIHFNWTINISPIDIFIGRGAIFMSAFFILSGFILSYVYYDVELMLDQNKLKEFYIRRFAKIYPIYFGGLIISSYTLLDLPLYKIGILIPISLLMLQSIFYTLFGYWNNDGMWSLSVEAFFYVFFPIFKWIITSLNKYKKNIFLVFYFLAVIPSVIKFIFGGTADLYVNPVFRLGEFGLGMLVCEYYFANKNRQMSHKHYSRLLIISCVTLFALVILFASNIPTWDFTGFNFVILPSFCYIIYCLASLSEKNIILYRLFCNSLFRYLGLISYSFYIVQFFVIHVLGKSLLIKITSNPNVILVCLFFLNILFAIVFYEFIEKKAREKLIKFLL